MRRAREEDEAGAVSQAGVLGNLPKTRPSVRSPRRAKQSPEQPTPSRAVPSDPDPDPGTVLPPNPPAAARPGQRAEQTSRRSPAAESRSPGRRHRLAFASPVARPQRSGMP